VVHNDLREKFYFWTLDDRREIEEYEPDLDTVASPSHNTFVSLWWKKAGRRPEAGV